MGIGPGRTCLVTYADAGAGGVGRRGGVQGAIFDQVVKGLGSDKDNVERFPGGDAFAEARGGIEEEGEGAARGAFHRSLQIFHDRLYPVGSEDAERWRLSA